MVSRTDLGIQAKNKVCASTETALKGSVMLSVHPHMAFGLQTIPSALPFAFPTGSALGAPAQPRGALGSGVCAQPAWKQAGNPNKPLSLIHLSKPNLAVTAPENTPKLPDKESTPEKRSCCPQRFQLFFFLCVWNLGRRHISPSTFPSHFLPLSLLDSNPVLQPVFFFLFFPFFTIYRARGEEAAPRRRRGGGAAGPRDPLSGLGGGIP